MLWLISPRLDRRVNMETTIESGIIPRFNFTAEIRDATTGQIIQIQQYHNMVTTSGTNLIRDLLYWDATLNETRPSGLSTFALGTGSEATTGNELLLGNEQYRDLYVERIKTSGGLILKYFLPSTAGNEKTYTEAGLFGNSTSTTLNSGTLYARVLLTNPLTKDSGVAVTFTWTLTFVDDGVGI
jgi:hypothetical protein